MPAAGTKKYVVTSPPNARSQKGMRIWDGTKDANGNPTGEQVYVEVGGTVMLTPEAAAPLIEAGRLRLASEG